MSQALTVTLEPFTEKKSLSALRYHPCNLIRNATASLRHMLKCAFRLDSDCLSAFTWGGQQHTWTGMLGPSLKPPSMFPVPHSDLNNLRCPCGSVLIQYVDDFC